MLRSILIGLDGSAHGANAVELGIRWAKQTQATLIGLGIIDEPTIREPVMMPIGASAFKEERDEGVLAQARRQVKKWHEAFAARCAADGVACRQVEVVGVPSEQILAEAQRYDLVLLGQQTFLRFATQETACDTLSTVLKNTPRPVATAPQKLGEGNAVMIAYDGSLQAARAMQMFQASGLAGANPVHVVTVQDDLQTAARIADRAVDFLRFHDIHAERHALESLDVEDFLVDEAKRLNAGLLVMGAYGQPTLREYFLGSVTQSLLTNCPVPLFLYH